jgi:N-acyl-D-aspartate/D-glutamate deacylase
MLDLLIRGGWVVDGTGAPGRRADVAIEGDRIRAVGSCDEPARARVDADGLVVAPGFIDPHTHYDCQLHWDPLATPSSLHGVTSVIGGNCGFTIAPLDPADADYTRRMMAVVEGMPLAALEAGVAWNWSSFGEWLDGFEGRLAINAGFLVGHCALRRFVLGAESGREASAEEVERMRALLRRSLAEGGLGLSTSRSYTHRDGSGEPVPSRQASIAELLELCAELERFPGTSLEFITSGCLDGFSAEEVDLMARMSLAARRPLNWNVLTVDSREPERLAAQLAACEQARTRGARVVALSMPVIVGLTMSFESYSPIFHLPGWGEVLALPLPERSAALRDPAVRSRLAERAATPEAGVFARFTDWAGYRIGETFSEANAGLTGLTVREIAARRGVAAFDALLDVVLADGLRTVLWPHATDDDAESWALRERVWQSEHVLLGGSDAGAHLDRMCGAPYPAQFLADCLRGRKLMSLEAAVRALCDAPARLFGLRSRGRVAPGYAADLVIFDPQRVGCGEFRTATDLPGGASRLVADPTGIERVLVNGRAIALSGRPTGDLPGRVLRSGRDTEGGLL